MSARCRGCNEALDPRWRVCPLCGLAIARGPVRQAPPTTAWQLWNRYQRHVRDDLRPFLLGVATAGNEELAVKVEAWRPARYIDAIAAAMRCLTELGEDTRLPGEFRRALTELGRFEHHEASIAQTLAPATLGVQVAVQALIEAGDINPGVLDSLAGYLERRDQANTFAEIGAAVTGLDLSMLRIVGRMFAGWLAASRATAREERWQAACIELAGAGDRLIDRVWDNLASRTRDNGLALPTARDLRALEAEADACWQTLAEQQDELDGGFELSLTHAHALASAHPDAYPIQQLVRHADLLAEVRAQLVGHWTSRICIGITEGVRERAQQHFLRLLPGDGVLAFFPTTVFGQGKAGLALTTSSVQWLGDDQTQRWCGYARLHRAPIRWQDEYLRIGGERIGKFLAEDAEGAGRALRACIELSVARPGPAVCPCGAPGHWLHFQAEQARCPGCGGAVHYV
ncbi:hypothetical protein ENSA5_59080 [Enhygromyxa salina]|uniref:Uncharacterized protein n=2 Tax=Enhygromyxa salina TaxID=215803 RepID=A0A2S9XDX3_9BACT|nr:hypothetical protein ENSA5_59080 [Enhygromyxa salina]